jgi:SAM-dependent methyltransferase
MNASDDSPLGVTGGSPASGDPYDPERFWDAKAVHSGGDFMRAVCCDDADTNRCIDRVQRHLLAAAMRFIARRGGLRGATLLDFGCGSGRWVDFFARRGCRYSGVDISSELLRMARGRWPEASFSAVRDGRIPYPDRSFDVACSIAVIHHNPYERQQGLAAELSRVVRDGGYLVLFESVAALRSTGGIEFPRPLEGWRALFADLGMSLRLYRGARYGILRWATEKLARRLPVEVGTDRRIWMTGAGKPLWQQLIDRLDLIVDPFLGPILPARYHRRALMIFSKGPSVG